ncbi:p-type ATPase, putative [Ichthyophthirius multifiliis]|uniref:Phospholipid-transporting ATPase n=1 Tax=Ichthyophthirius multifiliis TaxID=5932 RepID=G0QWD0_ICHMU|nr:p-type ATPase, putative [Ichthyophthirius multifiliis]EGR30477.1 p-type ATPase, putative [Ichthyophthirius multifiliis]|eukprot:XP_004032064.1 p-type ATPase, putative [Ichthyophthirius multifiliis]
MRTQKQESNKITVYLNNRLQNQQNSLYFTNEIRTSKYTWWNFAPKSLILQFMRAANLYFLSATIVQCINIISPLSPFSAIGPLVLVLCVSLSREAIEDYKRHRNDDIVNDQICYVFNNKNFVSIKWKDIQIGDIIKINNGQIIPSDILLITSSDENGIAFVETSNLDGENNLKSKYSLEQINKFGREYPLIDFKGHLVCEKPNNRVHNFKGIIYIDENQSHPLILNNNNILLSGCTLKNTEWVVGMVVYSGMNTKIMQNQGQVKQKVTDVEKILNNIIIITFIIQTILCLISSILSVNHYYLYYESSNDQKYILFDPEVQGILIYFTYFLLLNSLIPISLIISLEVVKVIQATTIEFDSEMVYYNEGIKYPIKVINTLIHEDLGKIEYIFTDKTGTLTCNNMIFKYAIIGRNEHSDSELKSLFSKIDESDQFHNGEEYKEFYDFWLCIILCHDVVVEEKQEKIQFQGSSPDEVCLVEAAAKYNFKFLKRTSNQIFIKVGGEVLTYKLLQKIDFTSERKRMSIIIQGINDDKIIIYTKGADSFLMQNLSNFTSQEQIQIVQQSLQKYSQKGLRTLCLGKKEIPQKVYEDWLQQYNRSIFFVITKIKKQQKLENQIENGFELLGATAVEDKLQDGVPQTLQKLHQANIKVWMLTGDKLETSENIGYLCNLLTKQTKVFKIQIENTSQIKLNNQMKDIETDQKILNSKKPSKNYRKFAIIIQGDAISFIFSNQNSKQEFLNLIQECHTVICCRSTPTQKALIVKFIKINLRKTVLAIGDGGNDVNMIQEADIGVGIIGKEGNQAALSSDYYFGQFRFLQRLLFVHGRWNLLRTSYFLNYFIFKNIVFTLQQFFFGFYSGFSGQTFWEDGYLLNFNSIITAIAPVYFASFEQDVNSYESEHIQGLLPKLYKRQKTKKAFSYKTFLVWFSMGVVLSVFTFFFVLYSYQNFSININGKNDGIWQLSISCFFCTVGVVWAVNFLDTKYWTPLTFIAYILGTVVLFFPSFAYVWDQFEGPLYCFFIKEQQLIICKKRVDYNAIYSLVLNLRIGFKQGKTTQENKKIKVQ